MLMLPTGCEGLVKIRNTRIAARIGRSDHSLSVLDPGNPGRDWFKYRGDTMIVLDRGEELYRARTDYHSGELRGELHVSIAVTRDSVCMRKALPGESLAELENPSRFQGTLVDEELTRFEGMFQGSAEYRGLQHAVAALLRPTPIHTPADAEVYYALRAAVLVGVMRDLRSRSFRRPLGQLLDLHISLRSLEINTDVTQAIQANEAAMQTTVAQHRYHHEWRCEQQVTMLQTTATIARVLEWSPAKLKQLEAYMQAYWQTRGRPLVP